jgi:hypothetical protein
LKKFILKEKPLFLAKSAEEQGKKVSFNLVHCLGPISPRKKTLTQSLLERERESAS